MPSPPTLKDLARVLGLSIPAVSLGLRHAGNISEATCRRIEEAARKMGYRPNPHAAALSSGRRKEAKHDLPLAILRMPLRQKSLNYPIEDFVEGIIRRAVELGYRVESFNLGGPGDLSRHLKILYSRGFEGIFLPPVGKEFRAEDYDWSQFCVVACGRYEQTSPFHTVRQEIFESTRLLFNEVIRRGYRRICAGLLRHDPWIVDDYARVAAAQVCQPPGRKKIQVLFSPSTKGLPDYVRWLRKQKADAAIGFSVGHYYAMRDAGIKIPDDIAFATLHGETGKWGREISGLLPLSDHQGVVAANRMDLMIRHREHGIPRVPEQIAIPSEWQEGTTLPFRV